MMNNKNKLDEMQKERRNGIGNQMFMIMYLALLVNGGLPALGVSWLPYPGNVMVITTVCMGIYLVRVIATGAYLPPKAQNRKSIVTLIMALVFSTLLAFAIVKLFGTPMSQAAEPVDDNSAIILTVTSVVGLISCLIVALIKKANNKENPDD